MPQHEISDKLWDRLIDSVRACNKCECRSGKWFHCSYHEGIADAIDWLVMEEEEEHASA